MQIFYPIVLKLYTIFLKWLLALNVISCIHRLILNTFIYKMIEIRTNSHKRYFVIFFTSNIYVCIIFGLYLVQSSFSVCYHFVCSDHFLEIFSKPPSLHLLSISRLFWVDSNLPTLNQLQKPKEVQLKLTPLQK